MNLKKTVIAGIMASLLFGYHAMAEDEIKATPVITAKVTKSSIEKKLELTGEIQGASEVKVYSKVSGIIEKLFVEKGDLVKKGQPIAIVEHKSDEKTLMAIEIAKELAQVGIEQSEAGLAIAKAGLSQASATLEQAKSTLKIAEAGIAQVDAQYEQAQKGLKAAKASLSRAEAQLENASLEKERGENLLKDNAIPRQRFDGIIAQYKAAKAGYDASSAQVEASEAAIKIVAASKLRALAQLEANKSQIKVAESAVTLAKAKMLTSENSVKQAKAGFRNAIVSLDQFKIRISDYTIVAPSTGVISQRFVDEGTMDTPAIPLVTITDVRILKIVSQLSESDAAAAKPGTQAVIYVDAYPGKKFPGKISLVDPVLDQKTRTLGFEIHLKGEGELKPGMFAHISLVTASKKDVIIIPKGTIINVDGKDYVYVISGQTASRRQVKVGMTETNKAEIIEGLQPGEEFVTKGMHFLKDGSKVIVNKENNK